MYPRHTPSVYIILTSAYKRVYCCCAPPTTAPLAPAVPLLVVDFDDTVTQGDTIGALIDAAIKAQARDVTDPDAYQQRLSGLKRLKERLVGEYVESFQSVIARHLPGQRLPQERGLNLEVASGFLDDINDFEQRMNAKVMESGILAGLQVLRRLLRHSTCEWARAFKMTCLQFVDLANDSSRVH
jgi:hypothetical protein